MLDNADTIKLENLLGSLAENDPAMVRKACRAVLIADMQTRAIGAGVTSDIFGPKPGRHDAVDFLREAFFVCDEIDGYPRDEDEAIDFDNAAAELERFAARMRELAEMDA